MVSKVLEDFDIISLILSLFLSEDIFGILQHYFFYSLYHQPFYPPFYPDSWQYFYTVFLLSFVLLQMPYCALLYCWHYPNSKECLVSKCFQNTLRTWFSLARRRNNIAKANCVIKF